MNEVSVLRLYLLRAMSLLIVAGMGVVIWPASSTTRSGGR